MPQARSLITAISYIKMASWPLRMLMCGLWTVPLSKDEQHNHKQWIPARSQPKQKQPQLQAFHIYAEQPTCKANMWTVPLSEEQHNHSSPQLKFIQWIRACNAKQSVMGKMLHNIGLKEMWVVLIPDNCRWRGWRRQCNFFGRCKYLQI